MMNILSWLKSRMFSRYRAMWLYRRGMMRAKLHKHQAAIADYMTVIEMESVSADVRAMALYNRALVYYSTACEADAIHDLNLVLEMDDVSEQIKTEARRKLVRMQRTARRNDSGETSDVFNSQGGARTRTESAVIVKRADSQ